MFRTRLVKMDDVDSMTLLHTVIVVGVFIFLNVNFTEAGEEILLRASAQEVAWQTDLTLTCSIPLPPKHVKNVMVGFYIDHNKPQNICMFEKSQNGICHGDPVGIKAACICPIQDNSKWANYTVTIRNIEAHMTAFWCGAYAMNGRPSDMTKRSNVVEVKILCKLLFLFKNCTCIYTHTAPCIFTLTSVAHPESLCSIRPLFNCSIQDN
ncbi:uncharacterized protein LOC121386360 [Gigantopelta aegis]|uniref:uncharacterized protein LOC121386360 n=1 Tax=Gigantopelta aegis TaxID=1735272 RepID=UPI001B888EF6|nr:uncharacterized protein LOC121386360 [Gigantopelta aegis]